MLRGTGRCERSTKLPKKCGASGLQHVPVAVQRRVGLVSCEHLPQPRLVAASASPPVPGRVRVQRRVPGRQQQGIAFAQGSSRAWARPINGGAAANTAPAFDEWLDEQALRDAGVDGEIELAAGADAAPARPRPVVPALADSSELVHRISRWSSQHSTREPAAAPPGRTLRSSKRRSGRLEGSFQRPGDAAGVVGDGQAATT